MDIKYLGTGAAEGVPAMFCSCDICKKVRALGRSEYRTRTQILIDGDMSIDFPPEAYAHSLEFGVNLSELKYVFVTHSHMDHFYAHDFILRGYKYAKLNGRVLDIYGDAEVEKVLGECTAREMRNDVKGNINFHVLKPFSSLTLENYKILTLPANHRTKEDSLLYYIERNGKGYLHLCDTYRISEECFVYLQRNGAKCRAVTFDCTFADGTSNENARHMNIYDNMYLKDKLLSYGIIDGDTKLIITHFSHNSNPTRSRLKELEKKFGVIAAYDGLEIQI